jgi:sialic acid synthase SpsE
MPHPVIEVEGHEPLRAGACRVIAEAGANHNNSVERAIEMARRAAEAGAWAVKYQLYKADSISVRDSPKYWSDEIGTDSQFQAFEKSDKLDYDEYGEVAAACRELGIAFFATPFDLPAVEAMEQMRCPIYKVASGDLTHKPLLEAVAATGKPVLLSTGAATLPEVREAIEWTGLGPDKLCLLACTLTYPTPDEDANFARVPELQRELEPYLVGTSDHTLGAAGAWMSAALGGVCVEKHYTLDKTLGDVPDHAMSVDPPELAEMVQAADRASILLGDPWIGVRESEQPARAMARRSVVLERDVPARQPLAQADLGFKRPGTGLAPATAPAIVGRTLRADGARGLVLTEEHLEP